MANRIICTRPYDCEIEYLESTGTQWIDTKIVSQNNLVYDFRVVEPQLNDQKSYFGFKEGTGWLTAGMNDGNWGQDEWSGWIYADFASAHTRCIVEYPNRNGVYHFDFTDGDASASLNGTTFWTSDLTGTYNGSRHVYIYYMDWDEDNVYNRKAVIKIYYFQIRKNGNLLFDGIPVRKGNEGYIYDRVSGKLFGNLGTGSFVLGQDIPNTAPTNRHVLYTTPYDSEVEYLESTGTQKINTQYYADSSITSFELNIGFSGTFKTSGGRVFISSSDNSEPYNSFSMNFGSTASEYHKIFNWFGVRYESGGKQKPYVVTFSDINKITYSNGTATFNNRTISTEVTAGRRQLPLMLLGTPNTIFNAYIARLYSFKITEGDSLILDLIPVRKENIGYLYDKVSGRLFANQGTGNFILGNDVANPVPKIRRVIIENDINN